jgi:hypothetical protein
MKMSDSGEAIKKLLNERLRVFIGEKMDRHTAMSMYTTIYSSLAEVMSQSGVTLTNDALNMAAQMMYDCIEVPGQEVPGDIFTKRIWPECVETKELALLAIIFKDSPLGRAYAATVKKRS